MDGLNDSAVRRRDDLELRPEDVEPAQEAPEPATLPDTTLDPEHLEVYGWESSVWRKIRGYLGF